MLDVHFNQLLTLDPRGRITLPARLKSALDAARVHELVFIVHERRLRAYTPADFKEDVEKRLMGLDPFDDYEDEKQLLRVGHNCDVPVDGQGRIVIPENFRELAGLSRDVIAISMLNRLEVWDAERFAAAHAAARARKDGFTGVAGA